MKLLTRKKEMDLMVYAFDLSSMANKSGLELELYDGKYRVYKKESGRVIGSSKDLSGIEAILLSYRAGVDSISNLNDENSAENKS